jgi:hypothetical protein
MVSWSATLTLRDFLTIDIIVDLTSYEREGISDLEENELMALQFLMG